MSNLFVYFSIFIDGIKIDDKQLKDDLVVARQKLCDKVNNGWIDHYNALIDELGMIGIDFDEYQDAYLMITNAYWTKLLHEIDTKYKKLKIESEVLYPITLDTYDCQIKLTTK